MEMKRMVVFMVMMLMIGNLIVESEVINNSFRKCFNICFNICISSPFVRNIFECFGKCTKKCGKQCEIDCVNLRCVSTQDPKKEIDIKKAKECVNSCSDMCDKKD
ncbi:unnamed protein product [Eruca vesicaria subsp. sativa]|uniref:Thionin-like protein n=1 Tax=Eruca vesicaria subsp. sativa TaxID=29727 RepID=A0ABC8LZC5_ERUVS|nr:unnamed protein product [Eruca vesicaria subsp. sativa]